MNHFLTGLRALLTGLMTLALLIVGARADHTLVVAQAPLGGGISGAVIVVNTNPQENATGNIRFYDSGGALRVVTMDGLPAASQFAIDLDAGASLILSGPPGQALSLGSAIIETNLPVSALYRFALGDARIGVLATGVEKVVTFPLLTTGTLDTGLAVANPGNTPINLDALHIDGAGAVLETIQPAALNPLPAKGQVALFVTQLPFTDVAGKSEGTIQLRRSDLAVPASFGESSLDGDFAALALVQNSQTANLASTALSRGGRDRFDQRQLHGSYTGMRNNNFGSMGPMNLSIAIVESTQQGVVYFELPGVVFAIPDRPPVILVGSLDESGVFNAAGTSDIFGDATFSMQPDGSFEFEAEDVPGGLIDSFSVEGMARPDKITGSFTGPFEGGGLVEGTIDLLHSGN